MDKVKVLAGLALGAIMVSCGNPAKEFKTELETIDSLQIVIQSRQASLDSIDADEMKNVYAEVDRQYSFLEDNFKDTTDRDFWVNDMTRYRSVMKGFKNFATGEGKVREELEENAKQLQTLENSVRDGKLKKEEVDEYLEQEVRAIQQTEMHFNKIVPGLGEVQAFYGEYKPKMDSVEAYIITSQQ